MLTNRIRLDQTVGVGSAYRWRRFAGFQFVDDAASRAPSLRARCRLSERDFFHDTCGFVHQCLLGGLDYLDRAILPIHVADIGGISDGTAQDLCMLLM